MSRDALARRAGVDPVTIWRLETGRAEPRRFTRLLLASGLGCRPEDLFDD